MIGVAVNRSSISPKVCFAQVKSASMQSVSICPRLRAVARLVQHRSECLSDDRGANARAPLEHLAIEQNDAAAYVLDQVIGLQPLGRLRDGDTPHAEPQGHALLRETYFVAIDAVKGPQ